MEAKKSRFLLFPLRYEKAFEFYKTHLSVFWTADELDLGRDKLGLDKLPEKTRRFILYTLAFFSGADGVVIANWVENFSAEVKVLECRFFYAVQNMMECIHSETYALLLKTYVPEQKEQERLINAVEHFDAIQRKQDWCVKFMDPKIPFPMRLIAFAILEGVFFSAAFCSIYYLKKTGADLPGLFFSNELISRDEGLHTKFATWLYTQMHKPAEEAEVQGLFREAVEIEAACCDEAIPVGLIGMNSKMMLQYVQFVADRLLADLGYGPLFLVKNPFEFMAMISLQGKTNFFEKRVPEYGRSTLADDGFNFSVDEDF